MSINGVMILCTNISPLYGPIFYMNISPLCRPIIYSMNISPMLRSIILYKHQPYV